MLYNLRLALLLAMLTVAAVAIVTITLLAGLATRLEFSRYVAYAGAIQDEQVQQAVLTFYEQQQRSSTQPPIPHPPNAFISLLPEDTSDMIFLYPLTVNRPRGTPATPGSLSFETAADGSVVIRDGDSIMGRLEIDPATQLALQPAQSAFVQFVNQSLLLAAGLAAVAAVLLTLILSQQVHQPIRALTMAARQMENGRLSQRVQTRIRGEIGDLAHAFNAMADALSRNELLRRQMVNDIAHELRTPLTNIRGYLEAMQDGIVSPEPATIDLVYEEAMLLNNIIQDLQELALAEAGQLRYVREPVALAAIIEQTLTMLRPAAAERGIHLSATLPPGLPEVYADARRVGQILRNLLNNALTHTGAGGQISISAAAGVGRDRDRDHDRVEVRVCDSGEGIPPEHLAHIFERFYRADLSRSRSTGGAGLGLAIVRQLVEGQGGRIHAESQPGSGSTFIFTLPVAQAVAGAA